MTFVAGDTLSFERFLPDFVPANGWSLLYEIRGDSAPITFTSVPDNDRHQILVLPAVTALWLPAECELFGYAVNTDGTRHTFYMAGLQIFSNEGDPSNTDPQTTHAERMVDILETQLEKLAVNSLQRTSVEQTEIDRVRRLDLEKQLAINKEIRSNEVAIQNVRNGRPSGQKIVSQMRIVTTQAGFAVNPIAGFLG